MESEPGADASGSPEPAARGPPPATAGWTRRSPSWRTWPGCRSPSTRRSSSAFTSGSRTPWATLARVSGRYRTTARASRAAERRPDSGWAPAGGWTPNSSGEGWRGPVSRPPAWSPTGGCWWPARPRASPPPRSAGDAIRSRSQARGRAAVRIARRAQTRRARWPPSRAAGRRAPVPGRRRVHRRLHRRPAAGRGGARHRRRRRLRAAGLGAAHRRAGHRAGPGQRARASARSRWPRHRIWSPPTSPSSP